MINLEERKSLIVKKSYRNLKKYAMLTTVQFTVKNQANTLARMDTVHWTTERILV